MKFTLQKSEDVVASDGHVIAELIGLSATNTSRYSVAHVVAPAGTRSATRRNRFDEIIIVESGTGTLVRDYESDALEPQNVALLPAGTNYSIEADGDEALSFWAICVPAFREEWSETGARTRDWRDYQVPRGTERLRPHNTDEE